ncbi:DEAH-box ATP-dependent RNA helicase prp22 [Cystobasidiomycetes sp. EMM_F5]
MDALEQLEYLELVNSLCTTLTNYLGDDGQDKTLSEFVISLYDESPAPAGFKAKLQEVGGEQFTDSLVSSLHRLISNMHPKYKKKRNGATSNGQSEKVKVNALSIPDGQKWKSIDDLIEEERRERSAVDAKNNPVSKDVEDLLGKLEGVGEKRKAATQQDYNDSRRNGSRNYDNGDRQRARGDSISPPRMPNGRPRVDDKPMLYKIYNGRVSNMRDFGAFVALEGISGRAEGMVHISAIQQGMRLNHPSDVLTKGDSVKVKVMSVAGSRLSLSMKDVDQTTGRDLSPQLRVKTEKEIADEKLASMTGANSAPLGERGRPATTSAPRSFADDNRRSAKRLTSPERWEIKQLIASGAVSASDYPDLNDFDANKDFSNPNSVEHDEELDIEVREDEAPFLAGQGKRILELSPVKIIKAPDGTMNRAALSGTALAKERRELRQAEVNDAADAEAKDLSSAWNDPMALKQDRQFAADARGNFMSRQAEETPAWKKETFNKATSFGKTTSLTMKEQREGLPIYKFRQQLVDAIRDVSCSISSRCISMGLK